MSSTIDAVEGFEQRRKELKGELASLGDMRPGSLVERYRKCGSSGCHCAKQDSPGHGPYWSLTREVDGKTITKVIPAGTAVERTRAQIAEYRRFRRLMRELVEVSERLCNSQLGSPEAASKEAAKKGGSKRSSTRRSPAKSKR